MAQRRRRLELVTGISLLALAAGAAVYPTLPGSHPAPMDELVEHAEDAPNYGVEAAVRSALNAPAKASSQYIDALAPRVTWDLPAPRTDRVDFWIDFLSGDNADRTRSWLERQGRFAPLIRQELERRGMPQDLLYLAMIESGLSPYAYSRARAVGMWQFIAETGRRYGLRVDSWVDQRRDPIESTRAALDYLGEMHDDFGSWFLAAAGYNSGENRVARLLRERAGGRTGSEDLYWVIGPELPRETRDYVPLMLAAAYVAKQPERYGFSDLEYQEPFRFAQVEVPGGVSLATVARAIGVETDTVEDLNPELIRKATPPGEKWNVRIPVDRADEFADNFERVLAEQPAHTWGTHRVRNGDTLWGIARRYDVSVSELRAWNRLGHSSRILPGQTLRVRTS